MGDEQSLYYVGIGSMMNPVSMAMRLLKPLESLPCRCVDFERRFWGRMGMAEISEKPGAEFHAVLHRMTVEDMATLDRMERGYIRKDIVCYKYDGMRIIGSGYQFDPAKLTLNAPHPPSERYVQLMAEGMEHFGCDPAAIAELRATPDQVPRKRPEDYSVIAIPAEFRDRAFAWDEIVASDGQDGRPLRVVFNGKVMEFQEPPGVDAESLAARRKKELEVAGHDVTHLGVRGMYDPKFPNKACVEEMSPEHIAYLEDSYSMTARAPPVYFSCVGTVSDYRPRRDRAMRGAL